MVLFTLVLALAFLQPVKVSAYVLPKDLPCRDLVSVD